MFKKDYSRQIASFILCALLVPSVACAQAAEQGGSTTDADIPESTPESQETTAPSYTGFDDVNYGGAEILIQTENTFKSGLDTCSNYLIETAGEETGDIVSDTAYRRNCKVEDMLNVKLVYSHIDFNWDNEIKTKIVQPILAGEYTADLYFAPLYQTAPLALENYFYNVADIKGFEFDSDWWYGDYMADTSFASGKYYILAGDYFIDVIRSCHALYFNKNTAADLFGNGEIFYDDVLAGNWTLDKFNSYVRAAYLDLNGDSQRDENDRYGLIIGDDYWGSCMPFIISSDVTFIERDENGSPVIAMNSQHTHDVYTKILGVYNNEGSFMNPKNPKPSFINSRSLFLNYSRLGNMETLRDTEDDVSPLPYPKYDESQEKYTTSSHDTALVGALPITMPEERLDMVSTTLEALCQVTHHEFLPVYRDQALKNKYARDEKTADMVDIIISNIRCSFPLAYSASLPIFLQDTFAASLKKGDASIASAYAKLIGSSEKKLRKIIEKYGNS